MTSQCAFSCGRTWGRLLTLPGVPVTLDLILPVLEPRAPGPGAASRVGSPALPLTLDFSALLSAPGNLCPGPPASHPLRTLNKGGRQVSWGPRWSPRRVARGACMGFARAPGVRGRRQPQSVRVIIGCHLLPHCCRTSSVLSACPRALFPSILVKERRLFPPPPSSSQEALPGVGGAGKPPRRPRPLWFGPSLELPECSLKTQLKHLYSPFSNYIPSCLRTKQIKSSCRLRLQTKFWTQIY